MRGAVHQQPQRAHPAGGEPIALSQKRLVGVQLGRVPDGHWGVTGAHQERPEAPPPPKILHLFFGFAIYATPLSAAICAPFAQNVSRCSSFEVFSSSCRPVYSLVFFGVSASYPLLRG